MVCIGNENRMKVIRLWNKLYRKWLHFRFQPIRVYCFHQVSDEFEPETMIRCDWMRTDVFKKDILLLEKHYTFISLQEATSHLKFDRFRRKRYAVLTADDGWASLKNIVPWLAEHNIPVTLFLNPSYFDGNHFRDRVTEKYLTAEEVMHYSETHENLFVASHGFRHVHGTRLSAEEFRQEVEEASAALQCFPRVAPYFAYPWGEHNEVTDRILAEYGLIPVLFDAQGNYNDPTIIHRDMLSQ